MKLDVHQHFWSEPLLETLALRSEFPFVRRESGLTVLYLAGERPYVIEREEERERRAELVESDGLDGALLCISSPLGIESLPRPQALPLIDAYHEGALALGEPFGAWGALAIDRPDPDDVDRALRRGFVGVSLPAGALAGDALAALHPVLTRLETLGSPLLVHPGPGPARFAGPEAAGARLGDPLWWPALTGYVAGMQAAWLAFLTAGRARYPRLRVVFSMLAGLAPLQTERLISRGGPAVGEDRLTFYDTSSYGAGAIAAVAAVVGLDQILYGSDRPVVDPRELGMPGELDWAPVQDASRRALGPVGVGAAR